MRDEIEPLLEEMNAMGHGLDLHACWLPHECEFKGYERIGSMRKRQVAPGVKPLWIRTTRCEGLRLLDGHQADAITREPYAPIFSIGELRDLHDLVEGWLSPVGHRDYFTGAFLEAEIGKRMASDERYLSHGLMAMATLQGDPWESWKPRYRGGGIARQYAARLELKLWAVGHATVDVLIQHGVFVERKDKAFTRRRKQGESFWVINRDALELWRATARMILS